MSRITKRKSEEINTENLRELIENIGKRHTNLQQHLKPYEKESSDRGLLILYNGFAVKTVDYERKLNDEIKS